MSMKIKFAFERATKNALRFQEAGDDPKIGTIYLKKTAAKELGITEGDNIVVTVEREEK